jgi:hypothetical protein
LSFCLTKEKEERMHTTTVLKTGAVLLAGMTMANVANADVNIRLRAGSGTGTYSVTSNFSVGSAPNTRRVEYDATYLAVPVGVTLITDGGLYVDLLHMSASGEAEFDGTSEKPDFSRDDTTLTIGGRKGDFSVYVGYKTGEAVTEWPGDFDPDKLSTSGFIAGLGWGKALGRNVFTLGGGVGVLSGRYRYLAPQSPVDPDAQDNPLESDTTLGFSVGAGYTYVFASSFSVNADVKWQSYDYDFGAFQLQEELANVTLNLQYTF